MLKSQELHSATEKNKQQKSKRQLALRRNIAQTSRWLHIYLSMVSFVIVLFFSVTGLTLNHADYFAGELKTTTEKGKLNVAWVNASDTLRIAKLEVVEYLRKTNNVKGELSEFRIDDAECSLSFKGPGYGADVFIDRSTGEYELSLMRAGAVAVLNDLHKGRDSGKAWAWVIDASAVLMTLVSLTGLILILYIKRKRVSGLTWAVIGLLLCWLVYALWVK
ncbi:peptidase [Lacibacter luteus]|uniref:Peptidase n=1 Tax=Lacibacter luteus TaxID=2508719 RepID=A0A4Q1CJB1_9BACT|nr:PepSY-associated TM helix domain-containing protein [Lacibacter luteus]RXK60427.1 peptidase [Lacibacter luteus]